MQKILISLSVVALLASGQVFADQATLKGLQAAGVVLTEAQAKAVADASVDDIADVIVSLAKANPAAAPTIVAAAVCSAPGQAAAITPAANSAVPEQAEKINAAVALGCKPVAGDNAIGSGQSTVQGGIPTGGGTGGGVASPN